jgi:hypothetical protein
LVGGVALASGSLPATANSVLFPTPSQPSIRISYDGRGGGGDGKNSRVTYREQQRDVRGREEKRREEKRRGREEMVFFGQGKAYRVTGYSNNAPAKRKAVHIALFSKKKERKRKRKVVSLPFLSLLNLSIFPSFYLQRAHTHSDE